MVTPFVGVWIEIAARDLYLSLFSSLPSWECGLKLHIGKNIPAKFQSLPSWECGLKFHDMWMYCSGNASLPSWECGLKWNGKTVFYGIGNVTPFVGVWIEICESGESSSCLSVTPFVGVWIEMKTSIRERYRYTSLPSWECGLKSINASVVISGT